MGTCYSCGKFVRLQEKDTRCDSCNNILSYHCHSCKEEFLVKSKEDGEKLRECKWCGFFVCPNCKICGVTCPGREHRDKVLEMMNSEESQMNKVKMIVDYFEMVKLGKERKICPKGVSISYAKGRNKSCFVKLMGYGSKSSQDIEAFKKRMEEVGDIDIGTQLTINQSREDGSYGQEYRDVFNLAVCMGKLQKKRIKKLVDGTESEFDIWVRCENGNCPKLDAKDLIVMKCMNKDCKIGTFPLSQTHCCNPECNYKRGEKKGEARELKLKISNKEICQLNRGDFKKDGEDEFGAGSEETE